MVLKSIDYVAEEGMRGWCIGRDVTKDGVPIGKVADVRIERHRGDRCHELSLRLDRPLPGLKGDSEDDYFIPGSDFGKYRIDERK